MGFKFSCQTSRAEWKISAAIFRPLEQTVDPRVHNAKIEDGSMSFVNAMLALDPRGSSTNTKHCSRSLGFGNCVSMAARCELA